MRTVELNFNQLIKHALTGYDKLLKGLASFGYVVAAPLSCDEGCHDDRASLPHDPSAFAHYYKEQLKVRHSFEVEIWLVCFMIFNIESVTVLRLRVSLFHDIQ